MAHRASLYAGFRIRYVLLTTFFCSYVIIAMAGEVFSRHGEFFPVFSWSLFSNVPHPQGAYEVVVHRIGERRFDPPAHYYSLGEDFREARSRETNAAKAVGRLGGALLVQPEQVEAKRRIVETRLFEGRPGVDYEVRFVVFDPLARWRDGSTIGHRTLGRFRTEADR